jgi:hypothetical protein
MEQIFIPVLVGVTSFAAYLAGTRGLGLSGRGIRTAVRKMLECLGMILVFLGLNVATGVIVILAARALTGGFVSLYLAADATLLGLSLIQGLAFQWWRDLSSPWPPECPRQEGRGEGPHQGG